MLSCLLLFGPAVSLTSNDPGLTVHLFITGSAHREGGEKDDQVTDIALGSFKDKGEPESAGLA